MNQNNISIVLKIRNYINPSNPSNNQKEELITKEKIEEELNNKLEIINAKKIMKLNSFVNLIDDLEKELIITEKDSKDIIEKKNELNYLLLKKNILNNNSENKRKSKFDIDFLKYKIFLKNIFIVINKKKYLNFFFSFSKLKNNLLVSTKTDQIINNIKNRITKIKNLFHIINSKKKKKPFITKRVGFLRWKIRANSTIVKNMLSKFLIQQRINIACIYRLKKISENKEYDRNMKFLNFVVMISDFINNCVDKRNFDFKLFAMKKIKFFCLNEEEKRKFRMSYKFFFLLRKKVFLRSKSVFEPVLENYPLKNVLGKIEKGNFGKKKIVFKKLVFFLKFYRFKSILKFIDIFKQKLGTKSDNCFNKVKPIVFFIIEKMDIKRKNMLKKNFKKLKLNLFNSNLKDYSLTKNFRKLENFLKKKKKKIFFEKLKEKLTNYNGFEKIEDIKNKKNNKNLQNAFKKILGNYNDYKKTIKKNFLSKLEKKHFLKKSEIFKKLKTPLIKKKLLIEKIDRKMKISYFFKKLYIFKKLQNLIKKKNKVDPKLNLIEIFKKKQIEKKFNIFYLLKKNSDSKKKK